MKRINDMIQILEEKGRFKETKNSGLSMRERLSKMKDSALNLVTDEVDEMDDKTMIARDEKEDKKGMFGSLKNKFNKAEEEPEEEEFNDDKTIKIVGFNKAEDDYLEILEGTQTMSELDVLKELQSQERAPEDDIFSRGASTSNSNDNVKSYSKMFEEEAVNTTSAVSPKTMESTMPFDAVEENEKYKNYKIPPVTLLNKVNIKSNENVKKSVIKNAGLLEKTLSDFGVEATISQVTVGPTITRYEVQPKPGVKVS